jgi:ELWxxDGT repeat protein
MLDPTVGGNGTIYQLSNMRSGATDTLTGSITAFGTDFYFGGLSTSNGVLKLHKMDSSGTTITEVSNTRNAAATTDGISNSVVYNGDLYFIGNQTSGNGHLKLWKYSGSGNTVQVTNFRTGQSDAPANFVVFNNKLYFSAADQLGDREMYQVDNTGAMTKAFDLVPGNADAIQNTGTWDYDNDGTADYLVFGARPSSGAILKLFIMDTSGYIEQVSDIVIGGNDNPGNGISWNGDYYFRAHSNASDDVKLFRLRRH